MDNPTTQQLERDAAADLAGSPRQCRCEVPMIDWSDQYGGSPRRFYWRCSRCNAVGVLLMPKASPLYMGEQAPELRSDGAGVRIDATRWLIRNAEDILRAPRAWGLDAARFAMSVVISTAEIIAGQLAADAAMRERDRQEQQWRLDRALAAERDALRDKRRAAPPRRRLAPPRALPAGERPVLCAGSSVTDCDPVIYGLVDPREPNRIRYVGQTITPQARLSAHVETAVTRNGRTKRDLWIAALVRDETIAPDMVLLERVRSGADLNAREQWWMRALLAEGQADLNTAVPTWCRPTQGN